MHRAHTVQTFAIPNPQSLNLFHTPPERESSEMDLTGDLSRIQQQRDEDVAALGANTGVVAGRVDEIESRVKTNLDKYYGALNNTAELEQYEAQLQKQAEEEQQLAKAKPETASSAVYGHVRNRHGPAEAASSPLAVPGRHRRTSSVYSDGIIGFYGGAVEHEEEEEEEVRVSHLSPRRRRRCSSSDDGEPIFRLSL